MARFQQSASINGRMAESGEGADCLQARDLNICSTGRDPFVTLRPHSLFSVQDRHAPFRDLRIVSQRKLNNSFLPTRVLPSVNTLRHGSGCRELLLESLSGVQAYGVGNLRRRKRISNRRSKENFKTRTSPLILAFKVSSNRRSSTSNTKMGRRLSVNMRDDFRDNRGSRGSSDSARRNLEETWKKSLPSQPWDSIAEPSHAASAATSPFKGCEEKTEEEQTKDETEGPTIELNIGIVDICERRRKQKRRRLSLPSRIQISERRTKQGEQNNKGKLGLELNDDISISTRRRSISSRRTSLDRPSITKSRRRRSSASLQRISDLSDKWMDMRWLEHGCGEEIFQDHPLLSAEEEIMIAKEMGPAKKLQAVRKAVESELGRVPTEEEWAAACGISTYDLQRALNKGSIARSKLVLHNTRLVMAIALRYAGKGGTSAQELFSAGIIGLRHAVEKFDPSRGWRLSTFATYAIEKAVKKTVSAAGNIVCLPPNLRLEAQKVRAEQDRLLQQNKRLPTLEEVSYATGKSKSRVQLLLRASMAPRSLDSPFVGSQDGSDNYREGQLLLDSGFQKSWEPENSPRTRLDIDDVIDGLHPVESLVIRKRFGLESRWQQSAQEVAKSLGTHSHLLSKVERAALEKLRRPSLCDPLRLHLPH
eukprot:TRINITY_DN704_c0_g1_i1.p1 TRINITY_DN704_c0_g1~~TRINITY_DN704_c0_g1_i1.p1  ORF type:complete len:650 (+),score=84.73 TRINITY_DN704_c0_g1_i1:98-2047(+)